MNNTQKTRLEKMKQQRDKLNARIQKSEASEKKRERKKDVRRKILIGAYILSKVKDGGSYGTYEQLVQDLDPFLTRNSDRKIFDLPEIENKSKDHDANIDDIENEHLEKETF